MQPKEILGAFKEGKLSLEEATNKLNGFCELDFAKIDTQRKERTGYPEVVYGEGKTIEQLIKIINSLRKENNTILVTRVSQQKAQPLESNFPHGTYYELARCFVINQMETTTKNYIAIVTAGTSDMSVAEEAAITAIGPINPALISLMVSPSISFLLALASSILAVTPTMTVPSIGFVLKKAVYA